MIMKSVPLLFIGLLFTGCDAFVSLRYVVDNKTSKSLKVFVPNYPGNESPFSRQVDTILEIKPHCVEYVGATMPRVTGPMRARKRIYKKHPGLCGLRLITPDSTVSAGCTKKEWRYKRGVSVLKIRKEN